MKRGLWTVAVAITIVGFQGVCVSQTTGPGSGVRYNRRPQQRSQLPRPLRLKM